MSQGTKAALDDLKHAGEFTKIENTAIVYSRSFPSPSFDQLLIQLPRQSLIPVP
jgi:hypothetical protein